MHGSRRFINLNAVPRYLADERLETCEWLLLDTSIHVTGTEGALVNEWRRNGDAGVKEKRDQAHAALTTRASRAMPFSICS